MVKFIVAIDEKKGMANEHGIPWQKKIPGDVKRFRDLTEHGNVLMGYKTYSEFNKPLSNRHNYVLTNSDEQLREGFEPVRDLEQFIKTFDGDLWVIGGAAVFEQTLAYAEQLYITQLQGDFNGTKFFPDFKEEFAVSESGKPIIENGISYTFQVWARARGYA